MRTLWRTDGGEKRIGISKMNETLKRIPLHNLWAKNFKTIPTAIILQIIPINVYDLRSQQLVINKWFSQKFYKLLFIIKNP